MQQAIELKIDNLQELIASFRNYKYISYPLFANAINATLAEVQKSAVDPIFQFITPRARRTGFLSLSFAYGLNIARSDNLEGSIGPTARYAIFVHEGTSRIRANPFMDRIARQVTPKADEYFQETADKIVDKIAEGKII